ncbi:MAG: nucleotidyltransferase substrate binding protein [Flavobacteriia bacterium]|nr:nucleotidyltransferase substrate binding protein [Flavobacteriia bacterium]
MEQDIRWKQRFSNYEKALSHLRDAVELYADTENDLIKEGIIQRFEFTHELAWNVMKDFLEEEGIKNVFGSKSATKEAFNKGLISDGQVWIDMIESRNKTVHTYHQNILEEEFEKIVSNYYPLFQSFCTKMKTLQ